MGGWGTVRGGSEERQGMRNFVEPRAKQDVVGKHMPNATNSGTRRLRRGVQQAHR